MEEKVKCPVCNGLARIGAGSTGMTSCLNCAGSGQVVKGAELQQSVDQTKPKLMGGASLIRLVVILATMAALILYYAWHANGQGLIR